MRTQIEKLIELANQYVIFGIEVGLQDNHNTIRGNSKELDYCKDGDKINVYFSNKGDTWMVTFKDVEVTGYSKKISIPFNADAEYLESVYNSANDYLVNYLLPDIAKCKLATMKERHVRIKALERELKTLKGLI